MFGAPRYTPSVPPQVNLRETDTLTELCHVAEAVVPHPQNEEYRLKRVFVDVGGQVRDPSSIPTLGSHEFIHAANQAQRIGVNVEGSVPTVATGFSGLKARFDKQQAAIAKQDDMIKHMKQNLEREKATYRHNCEERLKRWNRQRQLTETQLLKVFKKLEEERLYFATKQGNTCRVKTALSKCSDGIHSIEQTVRNKSLETRATNIEKEMEMLRPTEVREVKEDPPEMKQKKQLLLRQSKEVIRGAKRKLEACERSIRVMSSDQKTDIGNAEHKQLLR